MTDFFGDLSQPLKFFIAFAFVLALIGVTAWLVRRFAANRLTSAARGRQPRLAVIDAASVDGRRRLVLIRRDNIEHLLMIGGPTDVVVEQNIVRAAAARDTGRAEPRVGTPSDTLPRAVPLGDVGSWPLQPEPMPVPTPAPVARNFRSPTDEPWIAPEPPVRPREPSLPPDLTAKLGADLGIPPARTMAPPAGTPMRESAADASSAPQTDRNLAEMAQRLEAALRRPNAGEPHPPVTDPLAGGFVPPVAKPARQEPRFEPRPDMAAKPEPKLDTKPAPAKSAYDSLEQEMASLLGRPSGKT